MSAGTAPNPSEHIAMLQDLIDRTLPLRLKVYEGLNRPLMRPILGFAVSAYSVVRRNKFVRVYPHSGLWVHRFERGALVNRLIDTTPLEEHERVTIENFLIDVQLHEGDVVLDVGAGVGTELHTFARRVGPAGRVIAVEAHPETARCLRLTSELSGLSNVTVVEAAATASNGPVSISDDADHILSRLSHDAGAHAFKVEGRRLDDVLADLAVDRVAFLKMNIEGAEMWALEGMGSAIGRVSHVAISCHDFLADDDNDWRRTYEPVQAFLRRHHFQVTLRSDDLRPWVRYTVYGSRVGNA